MDSSSDEDTDYDDVQYARLTSRYRLHDACEFGDIETLQVRSAGREDVTSVRHPPVSWMQIFFFSPNYEP